MITSFSFFFFSEIKQREKNIPGISYVFLHRGY